MVEIHQPLDAQEVWLRVSYDAPEPLKLDQAPRHPDGSKNKGYRKAKRWARLSRFFYEDRVAPVTVDEYGAAQAHGHGAAQLDAHDDHAQVTSH